MFCSHNHNVSDQQDVMIFKQHPLPQIYSNYRALHAQYLWSHSVNSKTRDTDSTSLSQRQKIHRCRPHRSKSHACHPRPGTPIKLSDPQMGNTEHDTVELCISRETTQGALGWYLMHHQGYILINVYTNRYKAKTLCTYEGQNAELYNSRLNYCESGVLCNTVGIMINRYCSIGKHW